MAFRGSDTPPSDPPSQETLTVSALPTLLPCSLSSCFLEEQQQSMKLQKATSSAHAHMAIAATLSSQ